MKLVVIAALAACVLFGACLAGPQPSAAVAAQAGVEAAPSAPPVAPGGLDAATLALQDCLKNRGTEAGWQRTATGLRWTSLVPGDQRGPTPTGIDYLYVHYVGALEDGSVFDSSYSRGVPFHFNIGTVIRGWTEALMLLHPGEEACLILPPELAYGPFGAGDKVPPDANLIFHVKLLGIVQSDGTRIGTFE